MKLGWLFPIALLLPMKSIAADESRGRVTTVTIDPGSITPLHLGPDFESVIHLPEEVTSVVVGSPGSFHVEHSESEPTFVYVKPVVRVAAQSDLLIAMKSGQHVVLELISDGEGAMTSQPVDFVLEYKPRRTFVVFSEPPATGEAPPLTRSTPTGKALPASPISPNDQELAFQTEINAPAWSRWDGLQIETSVGEVRQLGNQALVSYSILNAGKQAIEIVPPQVRMNSEKPKGKGKKLLADQLEIRAFRLTATRLEAGSRADGALLFDRPNFKSSTSALFLQLAQADRIDHPVLVSLPFTPPVATVNHSKEASDEHQR